MFTDTIRRTFDDLFADIYDAHRHVRPVATSVEMEFGMSQRGRIAESVVGTVSGGRRRGRRPGVRAGLRPARRCQDGNAIGNPGQGAPTLGMSYTSGDLGPWQLTDGSVRPGPDELVIDQGSADTGRPSDRRHGHRADPDRPHARYRSSASPASVRSTRRAARRSRCSTSPPPSRCCSAAPSEIDAVMVDARARGVRGRTHGPGRRGAAGGDRGAHRHRRSRPRPRTPIAEGLGFFNTFLLVFAAIGLIVACFTIYNTFQIIVTQRSREMALLRAVGATRSQVLQAQLFEAVIIGTGASIIGLVAGVLVAGA